MVVTGIYGFRNAVLPQKLSDLATSPIFENFIKYLQLGVYWNLWIKKWSFTTKTVQIKNLTNTQNTHKIVYTGTWW